MAAFITLHLWQSTLVLIAAWLLTLACRRHAAAMYCDRAVGFVRCDRYIGETERGALQ